MMKSADKEKNINFSVGEKFFNTSETDLSPGIEKRLLENFFRKSLFTIVSYFRNFLKF